MKYPQKAGEVSDIVNCYQEGEVINSLRTSSFGAYMLIDEDLPEEWRECISYLNKHFAPNLRIIVKDVQPWYDYPPLGSVGWKVLRPEDPTSSEILNGETGR